MNDRRVKVIVISSVRPEPTSAGQIILHRHLVDQPGITLEVYGSEPQRTTLQKFIRRIAGRLGKTRLLRFVEDFWIMWEGRWIDPELPASITYLGRTIVLTVAHGDGFMAARRFARRHQLPLVSVFHDWWPDMVDAHRPAQQLLERNFKNLARESAVAFCVCKGMQEALGPVPHAVILLPIPAGPPTIKTPPRDPSKPLKIVCSGNLREYGPMLGVALEESLKHPEILLQVRGSNPDWSEERKVKMRENSRWLEFAPRAELDDWLASADAFLVPMVFDSALRSRMQTSFPSKLLEFAQYGKPIIIWGPEYCSAIQWARQGSRASWVTDPDPTALCNAIKDLAASPSEQQRLAAASRQVAQTDFDPDLIQQQFMSVLSRITASPRTF